MIKSAQTTGIVKPIVPVSLGAYKQSHQQANHATNKYFVARNIMNKFSYIAQIIGDKPAKSVSEVPKLGF